MDTLDTLFTRGNLDWGHFLSALVLAMVRLSSMMVSAPFFSSEAIPKQVKAMFVFAMSVLLAPVVASLPMAQVELGVVPLFGEMSAGLLFGFTLTLLNEVLLFAGQVLGVQFSFSLANLLDPNSEVQTPLMSQMFSLMGMTVLLASGLDRTLLAALIRSFAEAPLGGVFCKRTGGALAGDHDGRSLFCRTAAGCSGHGGDNAGGSRGCRGGKDVAAAAGHGHYRAGEDDYRLCRIAGVARALAQVYGEPF